MDWLISDFRLITLTFACCRREKQTGKKRDACLLLALARAWCPSHTSLTVTYAYVLLLYYQISIRTRKAKSFAKDIEERIGMSTKCLSYLPTQQGTVHDTTCFVIDRLYIWYFRRTKRVTTLVVIMQKFETHSSWRMLGQVYDFHLSLSSGWRYVPPDHDS